LLPRNRITRAPVYLKPSRLEPENRFWSRRKLYGLRRQDGALAAVFHNQSEGFFNREIRQKK
jgi:hypothetical protein